MKTLRMSPAFNGSTFGLQPFTKPQTAVFKVGTWRTVYCRSASGMIGVAEERKLVSPVHVVIRDAKRGGESSSKNHEDAGRIRSTLGIPSSMEWTAPSLPSSPLDVVQRVTTVDFWELASKPHKVGQNLYAAGRAAFFTGALLFATRKVSRPIPEMDMTTQEYIRDYALKDLGPMLMSIVEVYRLDADNVDKGYYLAPYDMDPRHRQWDPAFILSQADLLERFTEDFVEIRQRQGRRDLLQTSSEARRHSDRYPDYYLHNFHFQKDGWLSETSAKRYEVSTQAIFWGALDGMQRQGLVPLHFFMKGRRQENTRLLELACGTGRFLTFIKDNYPLIHTVAVDLSPFYLEAARRNLEYFQGFKQRVSAHWRSTPSEFVHASAESLPFPSESFDVVSCVYLLHELPPRVRRNVVAEMYRVLTPGGIVILQESRQKADYPNAQLKQQLSYFPINYNEPYYMSFINTDLPKLFGTHGFHLESCSFVHSAKVMTFRKS